MPQKRHKKILWDFTSEGEYFLIGLKLIFPDNWRNL